MAKTIPNANQAEILSNDPHGRKPKLMPTKDRHLYERWEKEELTEADKSYAWLFYLNSQNPDSAKAATYERDPKELILLEQGGWFEDGPADRGNITGYIEWLEKKGATIIANEFRKIKEMWLKFKLAQPGLNG